MKSKSSQKAKSEKKHRKDSARRMERKILLEKVRAMSVPKLNAIEVEFGNGDKINIHEPSGRAGLKAFLNAMPALTILQRVFSQIQDIDKGVVDYTKVDISDSVIDAVYSLFGVMTEITVQDFENLSVSNQLVLLRGFSLFAPKNPSAPAVTSSTEPVTETLLPSTPLLTN